ncbi:MAG: indolepyruvate ferredoxin oxidoreductase family protein [Gammaproteobacteria bacterium]|nr:indolepyruvate ferredoxin oxidoreductase family protein [Gammaproteobacteria bacterium]
MSQPTTALATVDLDDKYTRARGRVFLTGIQALVRLVLAQRQRDAAAGHDTAGYISGYRGSPLGGLDLQLERAKPHLERHHVVFQPGVNEDVAATACWGTQQAELDGEGTRDGVFCLWYGKGPGVDRSGDVLRHANLAGTSKLGGVVALLGDDHTCESSTTAHHSEYAMVDASIPVLNPAGVQEILDFGLYAFALSRYSGCWVALKCIHDTVEAAASVEIDPERIEVVIPDDPVVPPQGLGIRWPDTPREQEARLYERKLEAVKAFGRANRLDRMVWDSERAWLGVATTGKSYLDVRQAFEDLGIDEGAARRLGVRLYKVAMPFPLEPEGARRFAGGLETILVVEEKRALIETQLKDVLYATPDAARILGKRDEADRLLFPAAGRLDTNHIAVEIGRRLLARGGDSALTDHLATRVAELETILGGGDADLAAMIRTPYFCPGCPHNSSTRVPEGSRALAGIGCHYLAQFMERSTARFTHMGGEGASWIGEAKFSKRRHVFQNIGDGTYFHSGLLSIRAAIAADVNITFKILYNDAVAMTGGQQVDGSLTVPAITRQVQAEGARRIVVVTDEPEKYGSRSGLAPGTTVHHRSELDAAQRMLRDIAGVTVLVYDQTCAAEKRRRRKRGRYPDPPRRAFINPAVCEGCGDCGVKSNCVAVVPFETEFGRKRAIDQSACNKDFSCVEGFCPSFVTVHGGSLRRGTGVSRDGAPMPEPPEPALPRLDRPYEIIVTGVGGTGVITIGALLGMAAHLESKGCSVLDQTGLAQKGGAVVSHVRIAARPDGITTTRIANGAAHLVLGCDVVVTAGADTRAAMRTGRTAVVVNTQETMTGDFTRDADLVFPADALMRGIERAAGARQVDRVDATRIATALVGDAIATNMFILGYAWQKGRIPLSREAIRRAIEINAVAVESNLSAFDWGRRTAADRDAVERRAGSGVEVAPPRKRESLESVVERRAAFLVEYQDAAYARRYRDLVERVQAGERSRAKGMRGFAEAVARGYFKLLACKDEYEVARLHASPEFRRRLEATFEGDFRLEFHLAPPLLARRDPNTGEPRKRRYGAWMMRVFGVLAKLRGLRGTMLDPFGYTAERRRERRLIERYEQVVSSCIDGLDHANHAIAVEIASLPDRIRGFGHVKARSIEEAERREAELLARFGAAVDSPDAA